VLRLFGVLVLVLAGAGGILFVDFNRTLQQASAADLPPPSFRSYLESVPGKVASLRASLPAATRTAPLADMLPPAPEGWTMRPVDPKDIEGFLPKAKGDGDGAMIDLVKAAGSTRVAKGVSVAIQAYEKGERRVVIQLVRHPDSVFSGLDAIDQRHALQSWAAEQRGRMFLTVRGLDVTEEFLGDGLRARYFSASAGAQIQLRLLASKRLKDDDLLPFFEALDVAAMNANVVDPEPGLGKVSVLVLPSAMSEADRTDYEADRAARSMAAAERADALRDAARAELAALGSGATGDAPVVAPKTGLTSECKKDSSGIKRCSISPDG
jgi:hypothetical protein